MSAEPGGQEIHDGRRRVRSISQLRHLLAGLQQLAQLRRIHLGAGPVRIQNLEPAFLLQHAHNVQRIVFVGQLLNFVAHGFVGDVLDVIVFLGGLKAGLGAFLERPVKARRKAAGPDQPRGIFDKSVVMQDAENLGFNISSAVERVHQQAARARIQRQGHGIDGEIPAAQVFDERGGRNDRRLARFLVVLDARHADFGANVSRAGPDTGS